MTITLHIDPTRGIIATIAIIVIVAVVAWTIYLRRRANG